MTRTLSSIKHESEAREIEIRQICDLYCEEKYLRTSSHRQIIGLI